jgi:hypothetical protein
VQSFGGSVSGSCTSSHTIVMAVLCMRAITASAGRFGCAERIRAATPEACGAAMDVPWIQPYRAHTFWPSTTAQSSTSRRFTVLNGGASDPQAFSTRPNGLGAWPEDPPGAVTSTAAFP